MKQLFSLEGKVALVTGGSRGIGMMIARGLLEYGAKVYISSRKAAVCDETCRTLSAYGECVSLPADLSRLDEIARVTQELAVREPCLPVGADGRGLEVVHPARVRRKREQGEERDEQESDVSMCFHVLFCADHLTENHAGLGGSAGAAFAAASCLAL